MDDTLILPVYLNQQYVFDLTAMERGGLATVRKVSESVKRSRGTSADIQTDADAGSTWASLFKIKLSAKATGASKDESDLSSTEDRVHTPASLFQSLWKDLRASKRIVDLERCENPPEPGTMIELRCSLRRNPVVDAFTSILEGSKMVAGPPPPPPIVQKGKIIKVPSVDPQQSEARQVVSRLESLLAILQVGRSVDLISRVPAEGYAIIVTVDSQYVTDPRMMDLVDGTYRVVGKVVTAVRDGDSKISLIRHSALSVLPTATLQAAFGGIATVNARDGFKLPHLVWEICAPYIHVIPIAIFA